MSGIGRVVSVLCIALASSAASGQLDASTVAGPHHDLGSCGVILRNESPCVLLDEADRGPQRPPSDEKVVVPEGTHVVLLLSGKLSGKQSRERRILSGRFTRQDRTPTPSLIAVQDLVVKGVKVVADGTAAQFMPSGDNARLMNLPGSVGFEVMGINSTRGEVLPLYASQSARGEPPCVDQSCGFLPFFFWLHGDPGKIDAGLLFNATVTEDVELDGLTLPSSMVVAAQPSLARLHFYEVIQPPAGGAGFENPERLGNLTDLHFDGKRTGRMEGFQYACITATPGKHSLRVGHEEYTLDAQAGQELYIRVTSSTRAKLVESTSGYEFGDTPLKPARFRATGAVACFTPLNELANMHAQN